MPLLQVGGVWRCCQRCQFNDARARASVRRPRSASFRRASTPPNAVGPVTSRIAGRSPNPGKVECERSPPPLLTDFAVDDHVPAIGLLRKHDVLPHLLAFESEERSDRARWKVSVVVIEHNVLIVLR